MDFYLSLGTVAATIFTLLCSVFYIVYRKNNVQQNKITASPPSSSLFLSLPSFYPPHSWDYDVYPSFHGQDVRKGFLQKEFKRKAITTFIDNSIDRGEFIGPELKRAIQASKIAIVLLSKNYASSSWCLDELVEIMSKVEGQTVLTVFYDVDPTDVKKQTGEFGKVFKETCRNRTKEKTEKWKKALEAVATIRYLSKKSRSYWGKFSKETLNGEIADDISKWLIRIWDPPGIGMSILVRFLFHQLSRHFQLSAIYVNIRRNYPSPCLDEGSAKLELQNHIYPSTESSSSSSISLTPRSSSPRNWIHDVFPSFHGADVRKTILGHILKEFKRKGIYSFIDNDIKRGESIGPELKKAIRGSKIAIVLISKNYASSSWCLRELAEIMMSRTELGQKVLVVFYEVDPTDVKKQTGDFGKVFKETCLDKTKEEVETWRQALEGLVTITEDTENISNERSQGKNNEETETWRQALADVATIAGYHSTNWDSETDMIEKIATDVSDILNNFIPSGDNDKLVGMGAHIEWMQPLLRLDLKDEVRMTGIWGPPGMGAPSSDSCLANYPEISN